MEHKVQRLIPNHGIVWDKHLPHLLIVRQPEFVITHLHLFTSS
jgi:hypothetical protein